MDLSCQAPAAAAGATAIQWFIRLPDATYFAAKYAVETEKQDLSVHAVVNGVSYELEQWKLQDHSLMLDLSPVSAPQLQDLSAGSAIHLDIFSLNGSGQKTQLGALDFSLSGSRAAITNLQARCQ